MVRYIDIRPSMTEEVIQHLRENFFADEPLNKAVSLCQRGESHAALEQMCIATMRDGHSVAAVEGDKLLGVALNGILCPGDIEHSLETIKQSTDEKYKKIFTILYTVSRDLDIFNLYQVDRILECRIISVSELARGKGVAKGLMAKSIEQAEVNGFRLFKADATGAYSQRICSSFGMEPISTVRYDNYYDNDGNLVFNVPPPHEALVVMVLKLGNNVQ